MGFIEDKPVEKDGRRANGTVFRAPTVGAGIIDCKLKFGKSDW